MPFNGIHNLRSANESVKLEAWQLAEIERCTKDPIYFIRHYVYINTKDEGTQLMKTYPFQDEAIRRFLKYRFNINKWSRQVGKSTVVRAFILWYAMFHEDQLVAMLANKLMLAKEQLQLLRESYINLPFWLQPGVKLWNKMSIQFANGCRIIIAASSSDGIRGFSPNLLYLDEFAFLRPNMADEFMASVFPAISSGKTTRVIITSCVTPDTIVYTPQGMCEVGEFLDRSQPHGGYEVPEYSVAGFRKEVNHGCLMHNEGVVPTIKVTTRYTELEGSEMHKYFACKDGKYGIYRAHELKEGDFLAIRYGMDLWGDDRIDYKDTTPQRNRPNPTGDYEFITPDLAYLFGLYIAEGNINIYPSKSIYRLNITCGDDVTPVFKRLNLRYYVNPDGMHYSISSMSLINLFLHVGFDPSKHAKEKEIPPRLMKMSKECTRAMLQGMYDGDGCADCGTHYRVMYASTSMRLIKQLRAILLNFGILTELNTRVTKPTKRVKVSSIAHNLTISTRSMVNKFFTDIGFRFQRKQCRHRPEFQTIRHGNHLDFIPYSVPALKEFKRNLKQYRKAFNIGVSYRGKLHQSRGIMLEMKDKYKEKYPLDGSIFDYVRDDIIWVPITKIEHGNSFVGDFSLNDTDDVSWCHSVIYQGIVGLQTPAGLNHFHRMWEDAVDEATATPHDLEAKYVRSTVLWNEVPGRDEQWGIDERARIGEERFRQEYMCEFVGSSVTLIDYRTLQHLHPDKPLAMPQIPDDYQLRIFGRPLNKQQMEHDDTVYVAALDTGYGMRQDYHVLQICYAKTSCKLEQVLVLSSNRVTIEDFCAVSFALLRKYHFPALTIEYNGGSGARAYQCMSLGLEYPNLVDYDQYFRGMYSTSATKNTAVMLLKTYIQKNYLILHDETTINELMSFTRPTKNTWGASGGNHDDHVTSLFWCVYHAASTYFQGRQEELPLTDVIASVFAPEAEIADMNKAVEYVKNPDIVAEQRGLAELQKRQKLIPQGA